MWTEFPIPAAQDWLELVARETAGKTLEQLSSRSWEGVLYPACGEPQAPPLSRQSPTPAQAVHTLRLRPDQRPSQIALAPNVSGLRGPLGLGPLAALAARLPGVTTVEADLACLLSQQGADVVAEVLHDGPAGLTVRLSGETWRRWGADAVHELAWSLAGLIEILRALPGAAEAARLSVQLCAGPRLLLEVAKLRAARRLWQQIMQGFSLTLPPRLEVIQDGRHHTLQDPYNNLLRSTVSALAGLLGQAESIELLPADSSDHAQRWSDNILHLLHHEAHLSELDDPLGGSGVIEELSEGLAAAAWAEIQRLEALGGLSAQTDLEERATEQRRAWESRLRRDSQAMVGVNRYVSPESIPEAAPAAAWPARTPVSYLDATAQLDSDPPLGETGVLSLPAELRWSQPFEELHRCGRGRSVPVLIAGQPNSLRRDFVQQWLASAGLKPDWRQQKPAEAVWLLCCEDELWSELVPSLQPPFLAGKFDYPGISVYRGCDRVAALERLLEKLP